MRKDQRYLEEEENGGARKPWYLAGGVPAANCIAAYKAVWAASIEASCVNLVNPATHPVTPIGSGQSWTAAGWELIGDDSQQDGIVISAFQTDIIPNHPISILLRVSDVTAGASGIVHLYSCLKQTSPNISKYAHALDTYSGVIVWDYGAQSAPVAGASTYPYTTSLLTARKTFLNGVLSTEPEAGLPVIENDQLLTFGAYRLNADGTIHLYTCGSAKVQAAAIYNTDVSAYAAALHTSIMALS